MNLELLANVVQGSYQAVKRMTPELRKYFITTLSSPEVSGGKVVTTVKICYAVRADETQEGLLKVGRLWADAMVRALQMDVSHTLKQSAEDPTVFTVRFRDMAARSNPIATEPETFKFNPLYAGGYSRVFTSYGRVLSAREALGLVDGGDVSPGEMDGQEFVYSFVPLPTDDLEIHLKDMRSFWRMLSMKTYRPGSPMITERDQKVSWYKSRIQTAEQALLFRKAA